MNLDLSPSLNNQPIEQPPARMVAGALAHLARHMETGCQRSAYLAAMLLEKVASDPEADAHLRRHARELVEILDREDEPTMLVAEIPPAETSAARLRGIFMGTS